MKKRRISAVLSAMVMACSTAATVVSAGTNAAEGKFPKQIRNDIKTIDITEKTAEGKLKYDFNDDNKCDYYDVYEIEKFINPLYVVTGKPYYKKKNNDTEVKEFNKIILSEIEGKVSDINLFNRFDLNGDNKLSPDDYCSYLKVLSDQFEIEVSKNAGVNTQLTATIEGLAYNAEIKNGVLAIPAEIYDANSDRIYPVTNIGNNAFSGNKKITRVEFIDYRQPNWYHELCGFIPERGNVTASNYLSIGVNSFADCENLTEVVLPQNVTIKKNSFSDTPFDDNNGYKVNGIDVYRGTPDDNGRQTILAYGADFSDAIDEYGTLTIPNNVTAINAEFAKGNLELKNIVFSKNNSADGYAINYIGEDAFSNCTKLLTINGLRYTYNSDYIQKQVRRFINSFNSTEFMSIETQKTLYSIATKIESAEGYNEMNDAEKALLAAKYLVYNTYYSSWDTNYSEFSLYPNPLYNTVDIARGSISSENAALNVRFTECDGISRAYALILDRIGIKNHTMGRPGHALNQVYIKKNGAESGEWYTIDLTWACLYRAWEICDEVKEGKRNWEDLYGFDMAESLDFDKCDSSIVNRMTVPAEWRDKLPAPDSDNDVYCIMDRSNEFADNLSTRDFFELFEKSKGRHIVNGNVFYYNYNEDHTKLFVFRVNDSYDVNIVKEKVEELKKVLDKDTIGYMNAFEGINVMYNGVVGTHTVKFDLNYKGEILIKRNGNIIPVGQIKLKKEGNNLVAYDVNDQKISGRYEYGNDWWYFQDGVLYSTNSLSD